MQLTLESDYAIRIIVFLAENKSRKDAKSISQNTGVTLRFSLKILRKLVKSGIIKSYKGVLGGYELDKKKENINMKEVIESVDDNFVFSRCLNKSHNCSHPRGAECCKAKIVFLDIANDLLSKLESVTIDQLID
ncbi:MAG: Rrf2 family transcriptional regulator [Oscillospiraceae bacterium]|nr:Rrf2 family transcriptional regulator [Oscillospiraceae bacterium]